MTINKNIDPEINAVFLPQTSRKNLFKESPMAPQQEGTMGDMR